MKLFKSTLVVSFLTFMSRVSGLVRDQVIARIFGAGQWTDVFFVVFKIPNLMRRLFAEGSFSLAFVPVLSEIKSSGDLQKLKHFINVIFSSLLGLLLCLLAIMELLAPGLIMLFAPGFLDNPEVYDTSVFMLRITLPYLLFISLVAFAGGVMNVNERFAIPALTPIVLNLTLIFSAVWLHDKFSIEVISLAVGVLIAGVIQLLIQVPSLVRLGLLPAIKFDFANSQVRKVGRLMLPTLLGSSVAQINILLDTLIATLLPLIGSVTYLYYADRMMEFPLGVFAIAIATVILPRLSRYYSAKDENSFLRIVQWSMSLAIIVGVPATIGLAVLAKPIFSTLFEYGEFTSEDVYYSSLALSVYVFGLPAFIMNKVLLPIFFSRKDPKTPVKIALLIMLLNVFLNILFVVVFWWLDFVSLHVGLALASSVCAWVQMFFLYRKLREKGILTKSVIQLSLLFKVMLSGFLMLMAVLSYYSVLDQFNQYFWYWRSTHLVMMVFIGTIVYGLSIWWLRLPVKWKL